MKENTAGDIVKDPPMDARPDLVSADDDALAAAMRRAMALGCIDGERGDTRESYEVVRSIARRWLAGQRDALFGAYKLGFLSRTAWGIAPAPGPCAIESGEMVPDPTRVDRFVGTFVVRVSMPMGMEREEAEAALDDVSIDFGGVEEITADITRTVELASVDIEDGVKRG